MFAQSKEQHGFTLVELLVVIAIILILAAALLFAINPAALLQKSRDSQRVSDINTLASAINLFLADGQSIANDTVNTYVSTAGASTTCDTEGEEYVSGAAGICEATVGAATLNDGTGWVNGIDFTDVSSGAPIASLPLDPTNVITTYYYRFCTDDITATNSSSYTLSAKLEATTNATKMTSDGGSADTWFEVGNSLNVCGDAGA